MATAAAGVFPLLERSRDLTRIRSALIGAREGRGGLVVVEGPAGIGKTAVLGAVRDAAAEEGLGVLRARGAELERDFAFGVVRQLFEPALAEAPDQERAELLGGAAGVAASLLGLPGGSVAPAQGSALQPDHSFAALHGLYWLCANLAAQRPACLVVDDAHWADASSLRFLAFLLTRVEELPAVLVLATRPCEHGADADLLHAMATDPSADVIRLEPLTDDAVSAVVELALGAPPEPEFLAACVEATGGTPFLVRELAAGLAAEGVAPRAGVAREVERIGARSVGRSMTLRLARLPEPAARLARALAILECGDLAQAAMLAGLDDGAAEAADVLATAGILEPGRPLAFVHPMVRAGIYAELSSGERARGHRAAADLFAGLPHANERVAEHLLSSDPAGDKWAAERLIEAARSATRSGAPEAAAVFMRRALAEPPPLAPRCGLLLELGMAEASAGLADWQTHLEEAVGVACDDESHGAAAMVLALALSRAQRFGEAVGVLDRASAALGASAPELAVLLEAAAVGAGMNDGSSTPALGRRAALRARAATDAAAPPEVLAAAAFIAVLTNEPAETGAALALRAVEAGASAPPRGPGRPWFSFATWFSQATVSLLWAERYWEVRPLLDASISQARASGDSSRLSVGLAHRAWLSLRRGDPRAAEADALTALAAAELPAPGLYRVLNAGVLVEALIEQGSLDAAEEVVTPLHEETETPSLTAAVLRFARGRLRVAQRRLPDGLDDLLAVGAVTDWAEIPCPSFLPWRSEAALAFDAAGDPVAARRLAGQEVELAQAFGAPRTLGVALRAAGVLAEGREGESLLREAVAAFEAAGAKLERARALADLGALLRRRNHRREARALLREALDFAHRAGARPLAEHAGTELRATGARPRRIVLTGVEALTASERRVAELAAQGMTNREIAQTLFVTARTVEGHLTSVFRKLQLGSRDELPEALGLATSAAG